MFSRLTIYWSKEEERLRSKIVSSPDRRQGELETKRVTLDNLRDECSDLEENLQNVKTMCGNVSSSVKAIKSQVVAVEQVKEEAQKYFESHGNYETTAKELGAVQKKSRGKIGSFVSFCYACVIAR